MSPDKAYAITGSTQSDQAENSTAQSMGNDLQIRILTELQVISYLLIQAGGTTTEDLRQLRQNFADSIT